MDEDQPARLPAVAQPTAQTPAPAGGPTETETGTGSQTWCHWHGGYTDTGRLITAEEQGSGPGFHRYACAPCRTKHRLTLWGESAGV